MERLVQSTPSVAFLDSHFYESMTNDSSLEQATRIIGRSSYGLHTECVIFPICVPGHWMLGIVNFVTQRYGCYDQLQYQRFVESLDERRGQIHDMDIPGPKRPNDYDCGVFVLEISRSLSGSGVAKLSKARQKHMDALRQAMENMHRDVAVRSEKLRQQARGRREKKAHVRLAKFALGDFVLLGKIIKFPNKLDSTGKVRTAYRGSTRTM
ncbi:hypothetical protein DYB28_004595 [Aphanomyces astaci]|uniref:Ubiquitin-like protease family profile domain-containing protein n=1 Tax=Aphanomyces astaci TaxID=112090 RepID=A0A397FFH1_APHAT|nr:hypothetical protein DYB30_012207 [Aphanomyces astaci]RHZ20541.1 hypothetical protein DYB31_001241 [Aphanomyces astaci]RLO04821.1 hypothetical protein DYB28_004595 [Aphanomyces astaci]